MLILPLHGPNVLSLGPSVNLNIPAACLPKSISVGIGLFHFGDLEVLLVAKYDSTVPIVGLLKKSYSELYIMLNYVFFSSELVYKCNVIFERHSNTPYILSRAVKQPTIPPSKKFFFDLVSPEIMP